MNIIIKDINYNIVAEVKLKGDNIERVNKGYWISTLLLKRPNGNKTFDAMRDKFGVVYLTK